MEGGEGTHRRLHEGRRFVSPRSYYSERQEEQEKKNHSKGWLCVRRTHRVGDGGWGMEGFLTFTNSIRDPSLAERRMETLQIAGI